MFTIGSLCIIRPYQENPEDPPQLRFFHRVALATDLLFGIACVVTPFFSQYLGIKFPPSAQWAFISAGATYTALMLVGCILFLKHNSYVKKPMDLNP